MRLFRIITDVRWNWREAKKYWNQSLLNTWTFHTDMDHLIPEHTLGWCMNADLNMANYYSFERVNYPNSPRNIHLNTFLVTKAAYFGCGGYDESYSGQYIGEGEFLKRLKIWCNEIHRPEIVVVVGRAFVRDASTHTLSRQEGRDSETMTDIQIWKSRYALGIETFKQPYKEIRL